MFEYLDRLLYNPTLHKIYLYLSEDDHKWVNSATTGNYESEFEEKWNAFWSFVWKKLCAFLDPCFDYGLLSIIIISIVIYYYSKEKKSIYTAMKCSFIYLFYWMIRGALG